MKRKPDERPKRLPALKKKPRKKRKSKTQKRVRKERRQRNYAHIDQQNCERLTGFTVEELLELSGVYGIHTKAQLEIQGTLARPIEITVQASTIVVEIETNLIKSLVVQIMPESKSIIDSNLESTKADSGISAAMLISQVDAARKWNSKKGRKKKLLSIVVHAYRNFNKSSGYDGYIVLGRMGFEMDPGSKKKFKTVMKDRREKDLFELLKTEEGRKVWEERGFPWIGILDLKEGSKSMDDFNKFRKSKGNDFGQQLTGTYIF